MAKSALELAVETGKWDAGLKKAKSSLDSFTEANGGLQQALTKESQKMQQFVSMMAGFESTAKTAKGQMNDYKSTIEQLTMQYNRMTEAQKQTIGQEYLNTIEQLKQKYQAVNKEIQDMNRSLSDVKAPDVASIEKGLFSSDKLSGMLQVFGGNLMTKGVELAAGAVTSLISETGDMIKQGVELARQGEGIRIAFERLGRGDILDGLREATHGTVSDIELMKAAVKFNDFKLPLDELGTMLAFAQQKAKDTGQSVDYMVDSIVTGLGRKSLMILDNLGLSAAEIKERMKETGDMTKAVGAIIRDQMAAAGDYVETAADRALQANVNLQNKMEELGRKFAPVEEASNQLWTSIKIGILDIIGGPLAELLNGLTEAGRRLNAMNDVNGNNGNGPSLAQRRLTTLRNYSGSQKGVTKQTVYDRQMSRYIKEEEQAWRKANEYAEKYQKTLKELENVNPRTDEKGVQASALKQQADRYKKQQEAYTFKAQAIQTSKAEYQKGAQDILNPKPVKVNIQTDNAIKSVDELKVKLAELQAQRKKVASGSDEAKRLDTEIRQVKADIKLQDPNAVKTTTKANTDDFTEVIGLIGNAQERVSDLQKQIRESWDQNEITVLNKKLKDAQNELDVLQGKLPKDTVVDITVDVNTADALRKMGEIDGVTINPKTFTITATDEALPELRNIQGVTIEPKTFAITATDEALPIVRNIQGVTLDPKTQTITATDEALPILRNIQGVTIEPKTFAITATDEALSIVRNIEGVTIDSKNVIITATDEAMPLLQEIEGVTIEPKTFAITATDEALPKLLDIQGVKINPKNVTVTSDTTEALQRVQDLVARLNGTVVGIKVEPVITDEDIERSLREQYGKPIEVPIVPMTAGEKMELEVRAKLSEQNIEADMQTLRTLLETQIKNGIEGIDIPTGFLIEKIMGEGVPDEYWQNLQDQFNEKLKELNIGPIKIDFNTGNIANVGKETEKAWRGAAGAMSAAGSALQSLEDPGAKIAGIVGQAIANIALGFAQATAASSGGGIFGWIAAIAGGLTTMVSTIAAIHSATGYAQGGIVDGRGGGFVGGMAYSGDNVGNVRLNSGELVLNRAQQNNLANALEGGNNNTVENRQPYVNGELIYLGLNNYLKRTGRGEIVVSKR